MSLINTEEAAKRLARVILSDIEIYNTEKIRAGLDLRRELAEGDKLFRSRVMPELASLFALAVSQKGLGGGHAVTTPLVEMVAGPGSRLDAEGRDGGLINTVEGARRLAGAILIEIQNQVGKMTDGAVLRFEIQEGRSAFEARVIRALASVFDEVLSDMGLSQGPTDPELELPTPRPVVARPVPPPAAAPAPWSSGAAAQSWLQPPSQRTPAAAASLSSSLSSPSTWASPPAAATASSGPRQPESWSEETPAAPSSRWATAPASAAPAARAWGQTPFPPARSPAASTWGQTPSPAQNPTSWTQPRRQSQEIMAPPGGASSTHAPTTRRTPTLGQPTLTGRPTPPPVPRRATPTSGQPTLSARLTPTAGQPAVPARLTPTANQTLPGRFGPNFAQPAAPGRPTPPVGQPAVPGRPTPPMGVTTVPGRPTPAIARPALPGRPTPPSAYPPVAGIPPAAGRQPTPTATQPAAGWRKTPPPATGWTPAPAGNPWGQPARSPQAGWAEALQSQPPSFWGAPPLATEPAVVAAAARRSGSAGRVLAVLTLLAIAGGVVYQFFLR